MDLAEDERKSIKEYIGKHMNKQNLYPKNDTTTPQAIVNTMPARWKRGVR